MRQPKPKIATILPAGNAKTQGLDHFDISSSLPFGVPEQPQLHRTRVLVAFPQDLSGQFLSRKKTGAVTARSDFQFAHGSTIPNDFLGNTSTSKVSSTSDQNPISPFT